MDQALHFSKVAFKNMHELSHAVKCSGYAHIKIKTIWLEVEKPYVAGE